MTAVASGDETALAALIDRYAASVHAYLLRHSGDRDDADDLLQETWVRVARSAKRFDTARRFRSWIYGIATNLARDLFRRRMTMERTQGSFCSGVFAAFARMSPSRLQRPTPRYQQISMNIHRCSY